LSILIHKLTTDHRCHSLWSDRHTR